MSSSLLTKAGKSLFEKHLEQYSPQDVLYEEYTNKKGKKKRRKRALPPGLSARDAKILRSVQRRAHYLDKGFSICGMRFGWTFIIGLIPMAGDVADASMNYLLVVRKARQAELPNWLVRRMLMNNAVSAIVGLIPIAGDVVLAVYKANSRNAALLEEYLRIRGEEFIKIENKKVDSGKEDQVQKIKGKNADMPAPKSDIEQIKPGAGKQGTVDVEEGTMAGGVAEAPTKKISSVLRWRPSSATKGKTKDDSESTSAATPVAKEIRPDRGKFIEDISSSGSGDQNKSGTLKTQPK